MTNLKGLEPTFDPSLPQSDGLFNENGLSAITNFDAVTSIGNEGFGMAISVYPNPTSGLLNIAGLKAGDKITIRDVQGQQVLVETNRSDQLKTIDLTGLTPGVYFIKIQHNGESIFRKIVLR